MASLRMLSVQSAVMLLAALLAVFAVGKCTEQVPLLMWTSDG
ncbi:ATPase H+ transporting accessory protein 1a, partial [Tachysurus ichikawai]